VVETAKHLHRRITMALLLAGGKPQPLHRAAAAADITTSARLASAAGICLATLLLFPWWQQPLVLLHLPRLPGADGPVCVLLAMCWVPLLALRLALCCWHGVLPPAVLWVRLLPVLLPMLLMLLLPLVLLLLLVLLTRLPCALLLPLVLMLASHLLQSLLLLLLLLLRDRLLPLVLLLVGVSSRLATLLLLHAWVLPAVLGLLPASGYMLLLLVVVLLLLLDLSIFHLLQLCINMLLQLILWQYDATERAVLHVACCLS
jgi:hypothetical protein